MIRNNIIVNSLNCLRTYVPTLSIDKTNMTFDWYGHYQSLNLDVASALQTWAYEISESWIYVSGASCVGDDTMSIFCSKNLGEEVRTGYVTFTSDSCANVILTINQDSGY